MSIDNVRNILCNKTEQIIGKIINIIFYLNFQDNLEQISSIIVKIINEDIHLTSMNGQIIYGKNTGDIVNIDIPFEGIPLIYISEKMYVLKNLEIQN